MTASLTPTLPNRAWTTRIARNLAIATATTAAVAAGAYELSRNSDSVALTNVAAVRVMPITARVTPPAGLPGYVVPTPPEAFHSPARWARTVEQTPAVRDEANRLRGLGFVAGVDEQLHGRYPTQPEVISIVEQFRSAGGARTELAHEYAGSLSSSRTTATRLSVAGIPGAVSWQRTGPGSDAVNVAFAQGQYYYLVGGFVEGNVSAGRRDIVRAAQLTYLLANGCVAPRMTAHLPSSDHARPVPAQYPVH